MILKRYYSIILAIFCYLIAQIFFLCYSNVAQVGSKQVVLEKRKWAKRNGFIQDRSGADTIFFMGNSHIASGIVPEVFDQVNKHKTHSFNLSLVGLQIPPHYFLLKNYLKHHNPPDYIIIDPSEGGFDIESFPSYAIQGADFFEVIQYAYYRNNLDVLLNYVIPSRLHWPEVTRYFFGKFIQLLPAFIREKHQEFYLARFEGKVVYGHNRKYFYDSQYVDPEGFMRESLAMLRKNRGYYLIIEQAVEGHRIDEFFLKNIRSQLVDEEAQKEIVNQLKLIAKTDAMKDQNVVLSPFVEKFFTLTKQYGINVILMGAYKAGANKEHALYLKDYMPKLWRDICAQYDNVILMENMPTQSVYDFQYFSDPTHLNYDGAVLHTTLIAEEFQRVTKARGKKYE